MLCHDVFAVDIGKLLEQGRRERLAGHFDAAVSVLNEATKADPRNSDVAVELGQALTALKKYSEAEASFKRALSLAPTYKDARIGLARIAYYRGRHSEALKLALEATKDSPPDQETEALLKSIKKAAADAAVRAARARVPHKAPNKLRPALAGDGSRPPEKPEYRFRLDIDGNRSRLSGNRPDWKEGSIRLAYKITPDTAISTGAQIANRSDNNDTYLEARLDHRFRPGLAAFFYAGGTPAANFLPKALVAGGAAWRLLDRQGLIGSTVLAPELKYARYGTGSVATMAPGIEQYIFENRAWLTARYFYLNDELGRYREGFLLRGDVFVTDRLRMFAGYADTPENNDGTTVRTKSVFGGVEFALTPQLSLRGSVTHEERENLFSLNQYAFGTTIRF